MNENGIAKQAVDAAYRVHTRLGPELEKRGLNVTRQQAVPAVYDEVRIHAAFYADLIALAPVHKM